MTRNILYYLLCSTMAMTGTVLPVSAQETTAVTQQQRSVVHEGTIGTATWTIDSDGVLTIGEGELDNSRDSFIYWPWNEYSDSITRVDGTAPFKVTGSLFRAFAYLDWGTSPITSVDLSGWDVSSVTDMSFMFEQCESLTSLNISNWDTSSVTDMNAMFDTCFSLTSLDLSSWDTSSVTDMKFLFSQCTSLETVDLSSWNTGSVKDMHAMFQGCRSLKHLDLNSLNTSKVTDMGFMFSGCSSLADLGIDKCDTSSVTNMENMFANCFSLNTLGLPVWTMEHVVNMNRMFWGCTGLEKLYISPWSLNSEVSMEDIFGGCNWLKEIQYGRGGEALLTALPQDLQSGWFLDDRGPYKISDLPQVEPYGIATIKRLEQIDLSTAAWISYVGEEYEYTGKSITPVPQVNILNQTLSEGLDYELTYSNNVNPGTAQMKITGINRFIGTIEVTFKITQPPAKPALTAINKAEIQSVNSKYTYTGKAIAPVPVVKVGGATLVKDRDYSLSYSNNVNPGTATITITGKGNYTGSIRKTFTIAKSAAAAAPVNMYRLYNPNSGEHFYTAASAEKDHLVSLGWNYEGTGWVAPDHSDQPVYRLYNANAGDHHYTMNAAEKDHLVKVGWKYEGIGWYSSAKNTVPLYRQYNPNAKAGSHNYTTSKNENDGLVKLGWKAEGIGWYALEEGKPAAPSAPAAPSQPVNYKDIYRPCVNHAKNAIKGAEKFTEQDNGLNEVLLSSDKNLYYSLQDLNGDGVPELSLCMRDGMILQLFTAINGKPVFVDQGWARSSIYYIGNAFRYYGSGGYLNTVNGIFTLNSNGTKKWTEYYFSVSNRTNTAAAYYRNTTGSNDPAKSVQISQKEFNTKSEAIWSNPSKLSVSNVNTY